MHRPSPPHPAAPPDARDTPHPPPARPRAADLPHALTFFLSVAQRRAVLRALRALDRSREAALLRALRLDHAPPARR